MTRNSPLTPAAEAYTWREIAARIGLDRSGGVESFRELGVEVSRGAYGPGTGKRVIVEPCSDDAWAEVVDPTTTRIDWVDPAVLAPPGVTFPFADPLPVLFPSRSARERPVEMKDDHAIVFHIDVVATCFFMLSRWEETVVPDRDAHDRFPASASVAGRHGFLGRPIVDQYALVIEAWIQVLCEGRERPKRTLTVELSHDVDDVLRFPSAHRGARYIAGDLVRRRSVARARASLAELRIQLTRPEQDASHRGIYELSDRSREFGLTSAFYFMTASPSWRDAGYDLDHGHARRCLDALRARGHEIGFHPGYHTHDDERRFIEEKRRMDRVLGTEAYGGRQHFLRFRVPTTWRRWERAGLIYDATLGYADREGFRAGTCHPFRPFDIENERELGLFEHPLVVMDSTLFAYRGLSIPEAKARIVTLAARCGAVGGRFSLLWHNTSLRGDVSAMYGSTLSALAEGANVPPRSMPGA